MNKEIKIKANQILFTKTDLKGNIVFGNDTFEKITGFKSDQYIGKPHNIIRHQDMPRTIFKMMWDTIKKGEAFTGIIKNTTIDGDYYWVATDFTMDKDKNGNIIGYEAMRMNISNKAKKEMEELYRRVREIEKSDGMEGAEDYINELLKIQEISFNDYMYKLINEKTFLEKRLKY